MIEKYLEQEGIAVKTYKEAAAIAEILAENDYCVMISREDALWIVNWVWSETGDRNDVIFINRGEYECKWWEFLQKHEELKWEEEEDGT